MWTIALLKTDSIDAMQLISLFSFCGLYRLDDAKSFEQKIILRILIRKNV